MKINPLLRKLESLTTLNKSKKQFSLNIAVGDLVSIIYYDLEKEQIRLQQFIGVCVSFKRKGLNTKIALRNTINQIIIEQQFFFYSNYIVDFAILRKF